MTIQNSLDRGQKPLQISLRCYTDNDVQSTYKESPHPNCNNSTVLVFSSQATQDTYQNLTVGSCGIWINDKLQKFCLFHDDSAKQSQIEKIKLHAAKVTLPNDCTINIMSRDEFITKIFFPYVYFGRATCVGFDLPFEISRLAIHYGKARNMQNGFSFKLSEHLFYPNIRVKSINGNASFVQFAAPIRKKSEKKKQTYRGFFVDLKTLHYSMTNESCENIFEVAKIENYTVEPKSKILLESIQHNIEKTITTHQLYQKLIRQFTDVFLLPEESASKMYSPASIGKEILKKLEIKPSLQKNPDFPKDILGFVMSSYYGGRTEVRIRKKPIKVSYLDFTSMYPTMFVLMKMNQFLVSDKITFQHTTQKTQGLLDKITPEAVSDRNLWENVTTICKIKPDNDILPVRSNFGKGKVQNIGLNYLKSTDNTTLWYTLPDVIASKLLTGKTPTIEDAITFAPKGMQGFPRENTEILKDVFVNPAKDDFIKQIIEKRLELKSTDNNDSNIQNILKIIANAVSYGIYIQVNSENRSSDNTVHGLTSFECHSNKTEYPSKHFNPIIATFLTGGARLILAAAECLVSQNGGYLAYCDTDSVMISPKHVKLVQDFFSKLNPYNSETEMFKIEKDDDEKLLDDVWFYGISSKRYVLYDRIKDDFQIYKYSLHGLGHLLNINQKQWWKNILQLHCNPNHSITEYDNKYSVSKLVVTAPQILDKLSHTKKIKPFNKMIIGSANRVDPETGRHIIPMAPFLRDIKQNQAPFLPFTDYNSGKRYPEDSLESQFYWKTLSESFADYYNHAESKSSGDIGHLKRLKIRINKSSINHIGKESNNLDESNTTGVNLESYTRYHNISEKIISIRPRDSWRIDISRSNLLLLQKKIREKQFINLHNSTLHKILENQNFQRKKVTIS